MMETPTLGKRCDFLSTEFYSFPTLRQDLSARLAVAILNFICSLVF